MQHKINYINFCKLEFLKEKKNLFDISKLKFSGLKEKRELIASWTTWERDEFISLDSQIPGSIERRCSKLDEGRTRRGVEGLI